MSCHVARITLAMIVLLIPSNGDAYDGAIAREFLLEYPVANQKLKSATTMLHCKGRLEYEPTKLFKGVVLDKELFIFGDASMCINSYSQVKGVSSQAVKVMSSTRDYYFSLDRDRPSDKFRLYEIYTNNAVKTSNQRVVEGVLYHIGMYVTASYCVYGVNVAELLKNPHFKVVSADLLDRSRVKITFECKDRESKIEAGFVVFDRSIGWAVCEYKLLLNVKHKELSKLSKGVVFKGSNTYESRTDGLVFPKEIQFKHVYQGEPENDPWEPNARYRIDTVEQNGFDKNVFLLSRFGISDAILYPRSHWQLGLRDMILAVGVVCFVLAGIIQGVLVRKKVLGNEASRQFRGGFTLVELLVVLALISILAGLLLPAVQSAREVARRASCSNNIKQIALGIHGYHSSYDAFPLGRFKMYDPRFGGLNPCTSPSIDKSLFVGILPWIENQSLYSAINHDVSIFSPENVTSHLVSVSVFTCPDDFASGIPRDLLPGALDAFGLPDRGVERRKMVFTSYSGNFGCFPVIALPLSKDGCVINPKLIEQNNGVFNDLVNLRLSSIVDGLSNTMILSEKGTALLSEVSAADATLFARKGWYVAGNLGDTLYTAMCPPNVFKKASIGATVAHSLSASSFHSNGVNVALADGSVRFIVDTVDTWPIELSLGDPVGIVRTQSFPYGWFEQIPTLGVWQRLSTRGGGEVLSDGSF